MPSHRHNIVVKLTGGEIFTFLTDNQTELQIKAEDLKAYCGGDSAAPSIRPERGARSIAISEFPNAEFDARQTDRLSGIQDGQNVNFSSAQILGKGASGTFKAADGKTITVENGRIVGIDQ